MKKTARDYQKEQTKAALLKTAYEVFARQGILNTRMSDIAEAAGVSHGTVFVHFASQEALVTEVVETFGGRIALRTHELAETCGCLEELLEVHLQGIREYEPFYTRLVLENRLLPSAARDVWVSIQSAISFHFSLAAGDEKEAGRIVALPAHMLFNTWIGLVHHYLVNGDLFAPEGDVLGRYGDTLVESFMTLIHR